MTTIRRIVTSKIDGNSADSTDANEVRPFGETAFYLDTNGNTNKLALMMFDGVRTHQQSKILSPGVLYGSNADSGDGLGYDTIKLIPDATLHYNFGDYNNHQHLVIDPTAPNHIHIRAGGPIDNSNADLFLGGELTHVKVSDNQDNVVIRTSIVGEGTTSTDWVFGYDGNLTLPKDLKFNDDASSISALDPAISGGVGGLSINGKGRTYITISDSLGNDSYSYNWDFRPFGLTDFNSIIKPAIMFPGGGWLQEDFTDIINNIKPMQLGSQGSLTLTTIFNDMMNPADYNWIFGTDGNLTLPTGGDILDSTGTSVLGGGGSTATGVSMTGDNLIIQLTDTNTEGLELRSIVLDGNDMNISSTALSSNGFVINTNSNVSQQQWQFGNDGGLTFPDTTVQTTAYTGDINTGNITFNDNTIQGNTLGTVGTRITVNSNYLGVTSQNSNVFPLSKTADTDQAQIGWIIRGTDGVAQTITNKIDSGGYWSFFVSGGRQTSYPITIESADYQLGSGAQLILAVDPGNSSVKSWEFTNDGAITFPDATVQTTAYVTSKTSGTWTVTPGVADYSFTVAPNGVYQLWVRGNIPNGIISYIATAHVTNSNVPVLGTQYAWNYTSAGDPILFTALPTQFIGTEGIISTENPNVGTSTNTFVFGLNNNTAENITVEWGYTKIS